MKGWYIENGPESDVVISRGVRLAEISKTFLFPLE